MNFVFNDYTSNLVKLEININFNSLKSVLIYYIRIEIFHSLKK